MSHNQQTADVLLWIGNDTYLTNKAATEVHLLMGEVEGGRMSEDAALANLAAFLEELVDGLEPSKITPDDGRSIMKSAYLDSKRVDWVEVAMQVWYNPPYTTYPEIYKDVKEEPTIIDPQDLVNTVVGRRAGYVEDERAFKEVAVDLLIWLGENNEKIHRLLFSGESGRGRLEQLIIHWLKIYQTNPELWGDVDKSEVVSVFLKGIERF